MLSSLNFLLRASVSISLPMDSVLTALSLFLVSLLGHVSGCPKGSFQCEGPGHICIPQSSNCNGRVECPQGDDEVNCHDPHVQREWDVAFVKRPDEDAEKNNDSCWYTFESGEDGKYILKEPHPPKFMLSPIDFWEERHPLEGLEPDDDDDEWTNKGCLCNGEKLFCQNLRLENLRFIPKDVEFLDLSGSRVENLDFLQSPFTELETLVLSGCYIEDILPSAFTPLANLRQLYLTNNRLRYLAQGLFSNGSQLSQLHLDYNQISLLQQNSFQGLEDLRELNLRHNLITGRESRVFSHLKSLRILHLNNNAIESLRLNFLIGLGTLETLSLHNNEISYIEPGAFGGVGALKQLYLNWNRIKVLESRVFCNLQNLLTLNLRGNEITVLAPDAFSCLHNLTSLNLGKNRFGDKLAHSSQIFANLSALEYIYFDHFWMCSWAYHVRSCEPKTDGISSLTNLLDSVVLRVCVWIMGILSIVGNIFVIFCRMIIREPNRIHSFYIRNLAAADLLMGVFLLCIASHDVAYRGNFLAHQYTWRHSLTCQISGLLSTWSSEASVLILSLITLDRYMSIVQPFAEKTSSLNIAFSICLFLWTLSFLLAFVPLAGIFPNYFTHFYTSNGLCLPLHIHNPYDPGWEYSFILFVVINSLAFIFMCFAYVKMLQVIRRSTLMIRSNQQVQDSVLAKRFALVVVTDFLCWAPIVVTKVVGMGGLAVPSDLYAWLAVFVLPVNSAINPIIYTLTTKLFKQQLGKMGRNFHSRLWRRRTGGRQEESAGTASLSIFRYRTQRTANTSFTRQSMQTHHAAAKGQGSGSTMQIQLNILVPPSPPEFATCALEEDET